MSKEVVCVHLLMLSMLLILNMQRSLVINIDEHLSQPNTGEQALEVADMLVNKNVDLVIIDSAALVPRAEIEGEMGESCF